MAALAGSLFFDRRPTENECSSLVAALQPMTPDGVSVHAEPGLVMVHGAFDVWAGERSAQQPARSSSGLVMTWDGRLDNRDDLLLRLSGRLGNDASDDAIALSTFERWGVEGLRLLIGDWSLVIWDSRQRTLHLARDYMGVRPLYYLADSQAIMWSSSLGELAIRADRADALDEAFVARFMALQFSTDVTPYQGIRGVPTATCVSFSPEGAETRQRFWHLQPGLTRYRDKGQYEEHLRALWIEAVGSRLRAEGTVWAELSGGLDSSSVVCIADALIKAGRVTASAIQPLSHVTLKSPEGDERRFIAEVEARVGVPSEVIGVEDHQDLVDSEWDWVSPFAARGVGLAMVRHVTRRGGRAILSGRVGDTVMGCLPDNSLAVLDDFEQGSVITALAKMRRWCRATQKPFVEIAWGLAVAYWHAGLTKTTQGHLNESQQAGLDLVTPRFQLLVRGDTSVASAFSRVTPSKCRLASSVLAYSLTGRLNIPILPPGVIHTYPFVHRPLVEYILAIPGEELSAPGETRSLMRRAFEGLVPERILRRTSKGHYAPAATRAARPLAASMLPVERLEVVRRGWIDPQKLEAMIHMLVHGGGRTGVDVRRVLRLEQWLTSRDRRGPAAMPKRKEVITNAIRSA
ncbi:MAG: hypothetical protein GEV06_06710 [Luteitalea sp.]|nr:hypothetical protein [Luteitalea sp.]